MDAVLGQIQDIKKKSKENQVKKTSTTKSSGTSSKKSQSTTESDNSTYDYLETETDFGTTVDAAFGCLNLISDIAGSGCLSPSTPSSEPNFTPKVEKPKKEKVVKEPKIRKLDTLSWKQIDPTFESFEIRPQFDVGYHYSSQKGYTYIDFLPGLRANIGMVMLDFRYNILTEYTDDFPDSFKSWEFLFMLNLLPRKDIKLALGTGLHSEEFTNSTYHEIYLGSKFGLNDNKDFIDADTRFSVDYETKAFPFFEIGVRYNKRIMNFNKIYVHLTLGAIYQNYYQSHDIWSFRGGVLVNIH